MRSELDRQVAGANVIGSIGGGLDFGGSGTLWRYVALGGDFGVLFHTDKQAQTVSTTGGSRTTSAKVYYLSGFAGLRSPLIGSDSKDAGRRGLSASVVAGRTFADGSADVSDCSNCPIRDLDVDGGLFIEPAVTLRRGELGLTLAHRTFLGGDQERILVFRVVAFPKKKR